jgi:hypothetical protein
MCNNTQVGIVGTSSKIHGIRNMNSSNPGQLGVSIAMGVAVMLTSVSVITIMSMF